MIDRFTGKVQPYMFEARKRGVMFDMGHGAGSFLWPVASKAMAQGFPPDTISTDLHAQQYSGGPAGYAELHVEDDAAGNGAAGGDPAIDRESRPSAIHRFPELGTLGVGKHRRHGGSGPRDGRVRV